MRNSPVKILKFDAEFVVRDTEIQWSVYHNLRKKFGISIDDALQNWLLRTRKFTAESFCEYVMSKDQSFVCMTEKQWKRLNEVDKL